jgi:hypothetical protein
VARPHASTRRSKVFRATHCENTSMEPHLYRIRFVDGPSDGVVVVATSFPFGDKLWMPTSPVEVEPGTNCCYMPPTRCRAAYKVSCKRHTLENGCPSVLYEFKFAGFEPWITPIAPKSLPHSMSRWLSRFAILISRWRVGLARWLVAPVNHPLKLPETTSANTGTSRRAKLTY